MQDSPIFVVWDDVLAEVRELAEREGPLPALRRLVAVLRPRRGWNPVVRVTSLALHLETERPEEGLFLGELVLTVLTRTRSVQTLTESGVPRPGESFWSGLMALISRRVLPDVGEPDALSTAVRTLFHRRDDHAWVRRVPAERWRRLMSCMGLEAEAPRRVHSELGTAIRVLAHHVASLGLHPEIVARMPELEEPGSPFLALTGTVERYLASFADGVEADEEPLLDRTLVLAAECQGAVETLRRVVRGSGTSLALTILSHRLLLQIHRMVVLLHLTEPVERDFQGSAIELFRELVRAETTRNQLLPYVRESVDLLAFEVMDFAARKGSKYIARNPREYRHFFLASMGAGLLVGLFGFLKVPLDGLEVSLAAQAVIFGVNYAICFVLIYLTGSILATKQPAMTANTLARALGSRAEPDIEGLKDLVVRVWRSQFIGFVGNMVIAFPVGVLLARGYHLAFGAEPGYPGKASSLLADIHPWESGAMGYAAVAGVFLFLTGLVSGWVANWNRHAGVSKRVAAHPGLRGVLGPRRAGAVAGFVDRNLGIVVGNVFLGFCLGSAGTVGEILGVPLDIRHFAFASAHLGVALEGLSWSVPLEAAGIGVLGVLLIGLVNFLVSFGLSLAVAMESRRVSFSEGRALVWGLLAHAARRPLDYFIPPPGSGEGDGSAGDAADHDEVGEDLAGPGSAAGLTEDGDASKGVGLRESPESR